MRIMLIGFEDSETVNLIKDRMDKKYIDYIFIDSYLNIEEAEYMTCIRSYDLIFMKNIPKNYLNYLNLFRELKNQPFLKLMFFNEKIGEDNKKITEENFKKVLTNIFSSINVEFIEDKQENFNHFDFISKYTTSTFTKSPDTIKHLEINYEKKEIEIFFNEVDSFIIDVPKEKDFKILIYFIRHYGEVISVDSILSGISPEPENILTSPIETGISTIRKLFKTKTPHNIDFVNPIKAFKRIGYSFQVEV